MGYGGVQGTETLETLLELGRETLISLDLGEEEGVAAADLWLVEDEEKGGARRLELVRDVGVPLGVVGAVGASVLAETVILRIAIDNMELGIALYIARCGVPVNGAEVSARVLVIGAVD